MADSTPKRRTQAKPGASLRALRKQRGWTLAEVSERTGRPPHQGKSTIEILQGIIHGATPLARSVDAATWML